MTTPPPGFSLSDDRARMDVDAIHAFLTRTYWAEGIPRETVERSLDGSLCFGVFDDTDGAQIGFARVITDRATFGYLCDVYVLESHRGRGLGRWLIDSVFAHPALAGLRRLLLVTRDAHALYAPVGFAALKAPERFMEIVRPEIYKTPTRA